MTPRQPAMTAAAWGSGDRLDMLSRVMESRRQARRISWISPSSWEAHSRQWIRWARQPGHDSYWRYHRVTSSCGWCRRPAGGRWISAASEGGRACGIWLDLGIVAFGIDASLFLLAAAPRGGPGDGCPAGRCGRAALEERRRRPRGRFHGALHDIDLMPAAVREMARVRWLPGGRLCLAIVHPAIRN